MLTVVIPTLDSAADLQALLPALVPAAVDGLVRDVILVDAGSTDGTLAMCEDAGAVAAASFREAAGRARGDLLLVLPPDMRLAAGWAEALGAHLARGGGRPAVLLGERTGWLRPRTAGVLASREAVARAEGLAGLRRSLRGAARLG